MNIKGEARIYGKKKSGRMSFFTAVGFKKPDGEWDNVLVSCTLSTSAKKQVMKAGQESGKDYVFVEVREGWVKGWKTEDGSKQGVNFFINKVKIIDEEAKEKDTTMWKE